MKLILNGVELDHQNGFDLQVIVSTDGESIGPARITVSGGPLTVSHAGVDAGLTILGVDGGCLTFLGGPQVCHSLPVDRPDIVEGQP